ncbi:MAG: GNAT family N-acetyltransferase, partial [Melioribacteraceae bacterium]|nr:GNAT family N-acetyltransferase [Melioribacteraceae bacterium]
TPLGGLLADDEFVREALLDEAIKRVDSKRKTFLQLKCYSSDINKRNSQIQQVPWRSSYFCELPNDPSKIRFGNKKQHHRVKWAVNKAKKLGITIREAATEEDIKKWYDLYLKTMRWHVVAVRPFRFFKFLLENLRPKGLLTVLLAEIDDGNGKELISGSFFLHFNKTFFYSFNGRCREGLVSHANDLIQWEAIHLATKMGYSNYDMGEVSSNNSSLAHYKTKWGCCAKPVYHYYYPLNEKMKEKEVDISEDVSLTKLIWRKAPLYFTMQWGILTNRFL